MARSMPPGPTRGWVCSPAKRTRPSRGAAIRGSALSHWSSIGARTTAHDQGVSGPALDVAEDAREGAANHGRNHRIDAVQDLLVRLDPVRIPRRETADDYLVPALMDRLLQDEAGHAVGEAA